VAAGFTEVHSAGADAAALVALVRATCDPAAGPLLLASGAGQGAALAQSLRQAGFRVLRRVAYAARPAPTLPVAALTALRAGDVAAVLVFSPASGRQLVRQLRAAGIDVAAIEALAISDAAAVALHPLPWRRIRVASAPKQDALLGLLA
jgi:uroporphyrinogen-III synthase